MRDVTGSQPECGCLVRADGMRLLCASHDLSVPELSGTRRAERVTHAERVKVDYLIAAAVSQVLHAHFEHDLEDEEREALAYRIAATVDFLGPRPVPCQVTSPSGAETDQ